MPPIFGIGSASKILISSKWIAVELIMTFKLIKTENHVAYKNVTCIQSWGGMVVFSYYIKNQ